MIVDTKPIESQVLEMSDNLLALSRRLDWRFVFADPLLEHVIVAGELDIELLQAVAEFSEHVLIWDGQAVEGCGTLVLRNPSFSLCRHALKILKPRRFYMEFDRLSIIHRLQRMLCLIDTVLLSPRGGYQWIRTFWHWPDIANANRIIPLLQSEPVSFVLANGDRGSRARLLIFAVDILRRIGLLALIVNGLSIVGERRR